MVKKLLIAVAAAGGAVWAGLNATTTTATAPAPAPATTAITHVRLFDGARVVENATVVFSKGVIAAAGPSAEVPKDAEVIDGSGKTLLPGLIDAHTHVFPGSLERALRFGVTTELDMFTTVALARQWKDEQRRGAATARADLLTAGTLITVAGGHGSEYFPIPTFTPGGDAQAFVDARIAEGSDYIKLVYDNGSAFHRTFPTLTKSDLAALIAAAHKRGKLTVVHISTQAGARDAIEAGADGLAHLFGDSVPDADFGKFVAAHHAFVVPTLTVVESTSGVANGASLASDRNLAPYLDASEVQNLHGSFGKDFAVADALAHASAAVRELRAAGVPLLAGTDAPNPGTVHGASIHRELELLVQAGLTRVEALAAATSVPAHIFGLNDRGRIAPGLRADLLLVAGDPTTDITATRQIASIWKEGVLLARSPETTQAVVVEKGPASDEIGFGDRWEISTDAMMNGMSTATMHVEGGTLHVHADTKPGTMFPWAGAMVFFGSVPMRAVDLSAHHGLTFRVRGDTDLRLMAFSIGTGRIPRIVTVHAPAEWKEIAVPWVEWGMSGKDMQAVLFAGPEGKSVDFEIASVRLH